MASRLRDLYVSLSEENIRSAKKQCFVCDSLLAGLDNNEPGNLAYLFVEALNDNAPFKEIDVPFIPKVRKEGRNKPATILARASRASKLPEALNGFTFINKEIPHLRASSKARQYAKGWIDFIGKKDASKPDYPRPVLGEIKWKSDKNPFYALIQLFTYLSEISTPNQISRICQQDLFRGIKKPETFDLHIFLCEFIDKGIKSELLNQARILALTFKEKLGQINPEISKKVGEITCFKSFVNKEQSDFTSISIAWTV